MSLIDRREAGALYFTGGKHKGRPLTVVAAEDLKGWGSYFSWVYQEASTDLSLRDFYELQDIMLANEIEFTPKRPKREPK